MVCRYMPSSFLTHVRTNLVPVSGTGHKIIILLLVVIICYSLPLLISKYKNASNAPTSLADRLRVHKPPSYLTKWSTKNTGIEHFKFEGWFGVSQTVRGRRLSQYCNLTDFFVI
jgi:hypothetical protein